MYKKKYKVQRAIVVAICVDIPKKRVAKKVNAVITFMLEPISTSVNCGSRVVKRVLAFLATLFDCGDGRNNF